MGIVKYYLYDEFKYTVPACIILLSIHILGNGIIPLWVSFIPLFFTISLVMLFLLCAGLFMSFILFLTFIEVEVKNDKKINIRR